jgi:hypothetical protein
MTALIRVGHREQIHACVCNQGWNFRGYDQLGRDVQTVSLLATRRWLAKSATALVDVVFPFGVPRGAPPGPPLLIPL